MDAGAINNVASSNAAMGQMLQNMNSEAIGQAEKMMKVGVSMSVEHGKGSLVNTVA